MKEELTKEFLLEALKNLSDTYAEKRSDVGDIIHDMILKGENDKEKMEKWAEHRFVNFKYRGHNFVYDTLTTLVETNGDPFHTEVLNKSGGWKVLKTDYSN